MPSKWPKTFPPLNADQVRINNDFVKYWHEVLPRRFGMIDRFNQSYPVQTAPVGFHRTLEIGAGIGEHLKYEKLTLDQEAAYHALELRENMSAAIRERFPRIQTITGDCQKQLPHPDGHFDRILAIHVLEHLPNLPAAVQEMYRLCDKTRGVFSVVIPCEGGMAYTFARRISAQRHFEKRYKQSYKWFIEREHINWPHEILEELNPYFTVSQRRFFPFRYIPAVWCNLVIGLTLKPRERPLLALPAPVAA
jgi:SAM-dependent methyltransferase